MFKKPAVAFILCLLVMLSSTVISVHARLDPRCGEISDRFRESGGISARLSAVCDNGAGIVKLAEDKGIDASEASDHIKALRSALPAEGPSSLFRRYQLLSSALHSLNVSLKQAELSDTEAAVLESLNRDLQSAQDAIAESDYNRAVSSFLRKDLGAFSEAVARLCGVHLPEQFA